MLQLWLYTLKLLHLNIMIQHRKTKQELALTLFCCLIIVNWIKLLPIYEATRKWFLGIGKCHWLFLLGFLSLLPVLSKVKMSPSHFAALLGVLGSELQLERRRLFRFGETWSSGAESISIKRGKYILRPNIPITISKKTTFILKQV